MNELKTYERLAATSPLVERIVSPEMAEAVFSCNRNTVGALSGIWAANLRKNLKLYKKHGPFADAFYGFGTNKAVIGVGAGPSFKKNAHVLKRIFDLNDRLPLEKQPFIIVATNKQLKPLLEMGICPHFTLLVDAGDALLPQFQNLPAWARRSILVAGLHASPKILKSWDRMGGQICFYLIGEDGEKKHFAKETSENPERIHIQQGGNVLNTLWILSHRVLGSSVYIMVGNDLSFKYTHDKEEREKSFYADGDYRLNILNKRDEAKDCFAWMGFDLYESAFMPGKYLFNLGVVGVSRQLWVYKVWLEVQAAIWAEQKPFFIYNCSESGISGVLARDYSKDAMMEKSNWFLIDELLPKRWLTTSLDKACSMFLEAKRCLIRSEIPFAARSAVLSPQGIVGARTIAPTGGSILSGLTS